ncbi:MAG: tRNA lysidine(34) synthetase TilS [Limisphaerales bacterium]
MKPPWAGFEASAIARGGLPPGCGVVVAVSGGRDSMVLLEGLVRWRIEQRWRLVVAHFHHQLRGAEADADQAFVAVAAAKAGLPFVAGTADVEAARVSDESWEMAARRLRHAFLARVARDHGCTRIALGHHAGDQAELFLLRMLRGAGGSGLGGMMETGPSPADAAIVLVRPLLDFGSDEVGDLAREWRVEHRTDATNSDPTHWRNRVRHELMPLLASRFQPGIERVLVREQTLLRDQAVLIRRLAGDWLNRLGASDDYKEPGFSDLDVALQREVVRAQLAALSLALDFEAVEALRAQPGRPIQVGPGRRVVREPSGRLRRLEEHSAEGLFCEDRMDVVLEGGRVPGAGTLRFGGGRLVWRVSARTDGEGWDGSRELSPGEWERGRDAMPGAPVEWLDADAVGPRVRLRHWRAGDRFRPIGLPAASKLQDLFTNARVPTAVRRRRVLAETEGGEIFWVEGLRIGHNVRQTEATARCLEWLWERSPDL